MCLVGVNKKKLFSIACIIHIIRVLYLVCLCGSKNNPNRIEGCAFKIFCITFIVEHTVYEETYYTMTQRARLIL